MISLAKPAPQGYQPCRAKTIPQSHLRSEERQGGPFYRAELSPQTPKSGEISLILSFLFGRMHRATGASEFAGD